MPGQSGSWKIITASSSFIQLECTEGVVQFGYLVRDQIVPAMRSGWVYERCKGHLQACGTWLCKVPHTFSKEDPFASSDLQLQCSDVLGVHPCECRLIYRDDVVEALILRS